MRAKRSRFSPQRPVLVVADEGADDLDAELGGGVDDLQEVGVHLGAVRVVRMEVVRVVGERGDLEPVAVEQLAHLARVEGVDVDVRHARVPAPLSPAARPAGDLERLEALGGRPLGDLAERQVGQRSGQEAELHRSTSTQRSSRAERAIASPRRISSWPSAKVGKSGSAGMRPSSTAAYTAR